MWKPLNHEFDSIATILEQVAFNDFNRNNYIGRIDRLSHLASRSSSDALKARASYWKAWRYEKANNDSAEFYIKRAIQLSDSAALAYDYARFKYMDAVVIKANGHWAEAYRRLKSCEDAFEQHNDTFWLARTKVVLGAIFQELREGNEALTYLYEAERLFDEIGCENCKIKNKINISNNLYVIGKKSEALNILKELEQNEIVKKDTIFYINVLISLFQISDQKETEAPYIAYNLVKQLKCRPLFTLARLTIGQEKIADNHPDSALYYFRAALISANENNDVYRTHTILQGLSESHYKSGNIDSAYYYLTLATEYHDSLLNHSKILEMNRMEIRSMTEQYELTLKEAEERATYHKNITLTITIALTLICSMLCYILWLARKKARITEQLKISENRELQLINDRQQLEIDAKNRELASNTLLIAQNNTKLKELCEQIEALEMRGKLADEVGEELKNSFKSQIAESDDWQFFLIQFEKVYPNFLTRLKKQLPNLTETELRLCAYIRTGMSAKEIAQILSVQPETVNTSRYRVRKKIGLSTGQSLEDYLRFL